MMYDNLFVPIEVGQSKKWLIDKYHQILKPVPKQIGHLDCKVTNSILQVHVVFFLIIDCQGI